jgi:hypothetical protein
MSESYYYNVVVAVRGAASETEARAHLKVALDRKPEATERRRLVLLNLDQADTERDLAQIARAEAALRALEEKKGTA